MFILYAKKNQLTVRQDEPITSGSVNVYRAKFIFSQGWNGMTREAVFIGSGQEKRVLLDESGECDIPWETVTQHGGHLYAGVYGTTDDSTLPTIKADLGEILEGVTDGGEESRPPTPDPWKQELDQKGDRLDYTEDGKLGLYAGDKLLSSVPVSGGGEGGDGSNWGIGHGLTVKGGDLTVVTTDDFKGDNTLPMTAAGVQTVVGNIDVLLSTI